MFTTRVSKTTPVLLINLRMNSTLKRQIFIYEVILFDPQGLIDKLSDQIVTLGEIALASKSSDRKCCDQYISFSHYRPRWECTWTKCFKVLHLFFFTGSFLLCLYLFFTFFLLFCAVLILRTKVSCYQPKL